MNTTTVTDERTFQVEVLNDRNIAQMTNAIDINSVDPYEFVDAAYDGTEGFRTGKYLVEFSRESAYNERRKISQYKNYVKPIVRSLIEPTFSEEAQREIPDSDLFKLFLNDVDACGTYIQDFVHIASNLCRRHGVIFIVIDNFTNQPKDYQDAVNNRIYPYAYIKTVRDLEDYSIDNLGRLLDITFFEDIIKDGRKKEVLYRKWTRNESILMAKKSNNKFEVIETYSHNLGVVPVVFEFADPQLNKKILKVDPPIFDICKSNWVIYNKDAETRDLERQQCFSTLYAQGIPKEDMATGTRSYINIPTGTGVTIPPGYASPGSDIPRYMLESQEQSRKDMFAQAERLGVVGVQSSESGIAKSYDFFGHETALRRTSYIAVNIELKIVDMFKRYSNEDFIYTVSYKTDFSPLGLDREIDRIDKILKMSIANKYRQELQKKLVRLTMSEEDQEVVEGIIEDIDSNDISEMVNVDHVQE